MAEEDNYERLAYLQRWKAAVHYTVGRICEEAGLDQEVHFTKQFIAALAETTFKRCAVMATDLELFAKHAKRSTINADDVRLLVRKSPALLDHIQAFQEKNTSVAKEKKGKGPGKKKKKASTENTMATDEDSNM